MLEPEVPVTSSQKGFQLRIEVLHIDECPNLEDTRASLAELVAELGLGHIDTTFTLIDSPAEAAKHRFAGSPTVLIDGFDAVPGTEPTTNLACRIYRDGQKIAGSPSKDSIRKAIQASLRTSASE
jgi:hypothetical protein|tara:strand:- start:2100 stop:2474 length:375 start_codon:yes stop_codon:yes gene_type:complete